MVQLLSWSLMGMTVANIGLLAERKRSGFLVGLAAQPLWLYFDYLTGAWGLMPLALVLGGLYVRGYRNWRV